MKDERKTKVQLIEELKNLRELADDSFSKKKEPNCPNMGRAQFERIVDNSPDIFYHYSTQRGATFWSRQLEEILGYSCKAVNENPKLWNDAILKSDQLRLNSELSKLNPGDKYQYEYRIKDSEGNIRWFRDRGTCISSTENDKEVEGIATDITEKKVMEERLRENEEKYRALYENAPLSYQSLNEDGCFLDVNPTWLKTLGYKREEVIGKWYGSFLHPDYVQRFEKKFQEFKKSGCARDVQFKIRHKEGHYLHITFEGCVSYHPDGSFKQTYCVFQDISKRKEAEDALKESEERFNLAMKASQDGLFDWNYLTNEIYYSPGWKKILGFNEDELEHDFSAWENLTHPDDVKKSWEVLNEHLQGKRKRFEMEFRMKHKDGHWVNVLSRATAHFDKNGKPYRIIGTHVDISTRKKLEQQLKMINGAIENSLNAFNIIDENGKFIYVNKAYVMMWGYEDAEEIIDTSPTTHCVDPSIPDKIIGELKDNGNCVIEYEALSKDGSTFDVLTYARLDYDHLGREIYPSTTIDITDRKRSELALIESERKFRAIFNNVHEAVGLHKFKNNVLSKLIDVNKRACEMTGYSRTELLGMSVFDLFVEDSLERIPELMKNFLQAGRVTFEAKEKHKNGNIIDVVIGASSIKLDDEDYILITARDVTEQKKYQQELVKSERKFREVLESIKLIGLMLDTEANITYCNEYLLKLSGWKKEEILGENWLDYFIPEQINDDIREIFLQTISSGNVIGYHENEIVIRDGSRRIISWNNIVQKDTSGKIIGVTSIGQDITERAKALEELKKNETMLNEAQKIAKLGSWEWDLVSDKVIWSDETYEIFEVNKSEEAGNNIILDLALEEDKHIIHEAFTGAREVKEHSSIEYRIQTPSGKLKFLTVTAKPIQKNGETVKLVGTVQDNTTIKFREAINLSRLHLLDFANTHSLDDLLEETLNEAEKLTQSKIGFYHFINDDQRSLTLQNWSTQTKDKFCKAEAKGMHYNIEEAGVWVECIYKKKPVIHNDYKSLKNKKGMPEGHAEVVRELVVPVFHGDKITAILGVGNKETDYTDEDIETISGIADMAFEIVERMRAEEELKRQEENIRAIFNSAPVAMMILNEKHQVVSVNEVLKRTFDIKDEDIVSGRPGDGLNCIVSLNNNRCGDSIECKTCLMRKTTEEVLESNQPIHNKEIDASFTIKGEKMNIWISLSIEPLLLQNRKHVIATFTDITERKKAEKALVESQRLSAIGEMSSAIAHDFNNSLQSIFGNLELALIHKDLHPKVANYLKTIKTSALDAAVRVDLLQRFSGQKLMNSLYIPININTVVEEVIVQSRPLWKDGAEKNGLQIEIVKRISDIQNVKGNSAELRSVVYNLVKNAVEAMPEGGDLIFETEQIEENVIFRLTDSGIGMSEETATRVFQPFYSTKGFELGRGLGMSGAYSIIREHNGSLLVKETQPGKGTTFEIILPATSEKLIKEVEAVNDFSGKANILCVDDDKLLRETIIEMLDCLGYSGDAVKSGQEALNQLEKKSYDLIITDIGMPGMSGWELASKIKEKYGGKMKVAIVTGWGAQLEEKKKDESGVGYVLGKPFKMDELKKLIGEVMQL